MARRRSNATINKDDFIVRSPFQQPIGGGTRGAVTRGANKRGARAATPPVHAIRQGGTPRRRGRR